MSEYVKKILVFDEIEKGFSVNCKKVSGVLKAEKANGKSNAEIFVTNFNRQKADELEYVLRVGDKIYNGRSGTVKFNVMLDGVGQYDGVACVLAAVRGCACIPFAFASNTDCASVDGLKKYLTASVEESPTQYEEFVCATDNFYDDCDFDLNAIRKNSTSRFKPIEDLCEMKTPDGKSFFEGVKDILKRILETYPPCDELNDNVKNSFWVKVPFRHEKYFAVGIVEENARPKYIVYGVPGEKSKKPPDESFRFLPIKNNSQGFWALYQDIQTGLCADV